MVLFRRLLGDVLRSARMQRGMTLRELSAEARVSLGYISEIERGQKEASSELLASLCSALDLPLSVMLREVSDLVALEGPSARALSTGSPTTRRGLGALLAAVRSGHGAVWVRADPAAPPTRDRLEQLARTERAALLT